MVPPSKFPNRFLESGARSFSLSVLNGLFFLSALQWWADGLRGGVLGWS